MRTAPLLGAPSFLPRKLRWHMPAVLWGSATAGRKPPSQPRSAAAAAPQMEFNQRFADAQWVAETKHWPPRLMDALDRFLRLA